MALDVIAREAESLSWKPGSRNHICKIEDRDIYGRQTSRFTLTAFSPRTAGVSLISYYVEEKEGQFILFKEMGNPYRPENKRTKVEIMEGITSFIVEVFHDNKWLRTWDSAGTNTAPAEIRITITAPLKDRPLTLRETVRPKIGKTI